MRRSLTTIELKKQLGEVLDRVALRQDEFVITRKGKPLAAVVSVQMLERLQQAARLYLTDVLDRGGNKSIRQSAADKLADDAKHATRPRRSRRRST